MTLRYLEMTLDDLDEVLDIERDSFRVPWTPDMFIREFENDVSRQRVAKDEAGNVLGYLFYWFVIDEAHLMNVAVAPAARRHGVGRFLMERLIEECRLQRAAFLGLEVRRGNEPAIALYDTLGFKPIGLRKKYYVEENEDAILMEMEFSHA